MIKIFGIRFTTKAEKQRQNKLFEMSLKSNQARYILEHAAKFNDEAFAAATAYLANLLDEQYA